MARRTAPRVVIAEDEALIRLDLREMLEEEGYEVVAEAADGEQAVALVTEHRPDLAVLDVKMPVLDGISAAEQIAAARIAPVVMLTAFSQRELVERARAAGAMAYLVKPFSKADLRARRRDGDGPLRRADDPGVARSPTCASGWRPASSSTAPRAGCMDRHGLDEAAAYRWVQRTSMDRRHEHAPGRRDGAARGRRVPGRPLTGVPPGSGGEPFARVQFPARWWSEGHDLATTSRHMSPNPRPAPAP